MQCFGSVAACLLIKIPLPGFFACAGGMRIRLSQNVPAIIDFYSSTFS